MLCAAGEGWENERNSVAQILNGNSTQVFTGALINNTCNLNIPYILTANHAFDATPDVAQWKFTFQGWSATCAPSEDAAGVTFNGSTLRSRNADSDFCLVQLNQLPPANSGITLSGWSRTNVASPSGVSITHPRGDIMKIATYNATITQQTFLGSNAWRVVWANGTVEPASSGGPLYDNNHRIIGQLYGGNPADICTPNDHAFFGRFDLSWTGGGTDATRLSNWLDPGNTGAITTNARGIYSLTGPNLVCTNGTFTLNNPPGAVTWSVTPSNLVSPSNGTGAVANVTKISNGNAVITFNLGCANGNPIFGFHTGPYSSSDYPISGPSFAACNQNVFYSMPSLPGVTSYNWTWPIGWIYVSGQGTAYLALKIKSSGVVAGRANNTCGTGGSYDTQVTAMTGSCQMGLAVYPNPASENLLVSSDPEFAPTEISLFNQYQERVYSISTESPSVEIPVSNLPRGIYILKILNKDGILEKRIVIGDR